MAKAEEFKIVIDKDGRIRMDFRGMSGESYRRIKEMLEETVGKTERIELAAGDAMPPGGVERKDSAEAESGDEEKLRGNS